MFQWVRETLIPQTQRLVGEVSVKEENKKTFLFLSFFIYLFLFVSFILQKENVKSWKGESKLEEGTVVRGCSIPGKV